MAMAKMIKNHVEGGVTTDSKLVKFESMIDEVKSYLGKYGDNRKDHYVSIASFASSWAKAVGRGYFGLSTFVFGTTGDDARAYLPNCMKKYEQNLYILVMENKLVRRGYTIADLGTLMNEHSSDWQEVIKRDPKLDWDNEKLLSESDVINLYKRNPTETKVQCYAIIFWMLFTTAIDDEIYNNELAGIIYLAYNLDFSEEMIRDWCRAIEYILAGNRLNENCDLECESEEGKRFFLHK